MDSVLCYSSDEGLSPSGGGLVHACVAMPSGEGQRRADHAHARVGHATRSRRDPPGFAGFSRIKVAVLTALAMLTLLGRTQAAEPNRFQSGEPSLSNVAALAESQADDKTEEDDLSERLIRQAVGEDEGGIMAEIMRLMDRARMRLQRDFDPGPETRAVQDQIIKKLDEAIESARRRQGKSGGQSRQKGDKRKAPPKPKPDQPGQRTADQGQAGSKAADQADGSKGSPTRAAATGRFREFRRGWGNLPARDRDEVLQGIDEDVLEKYRQLIERYFRTLAEDERE